MIGLYTQNKNTSRQLAALLSDLSVELYQPEKSYEALIWLAKNEPNCKVPLLIPNPDDLPWTFTQWRLFVQKYLIEHSRYENSSFIFDAFQRLLTDLTTNTTISLTEKETDFLAFLVQANGHQATKEEILKHVWQYSPDAETHTIESHLYALKQKIGTNADKLIRVQDGIFYLM